MTSCNVHGKFNMSKKIVSVVERLAKKSLHNTKFFGCCAVKSVMAHKSRDKKTDKKTTPVNVKQYYKMEEDEVPVEERFYFRYLRISWLYNVKFHASLSSVYCARIFLR